MKITRTPTTLTSKLTVDEDLDFLDTYQVANLAEPAADEALRKGNKDIGNAEIANAAAITYSKLNLALMIRNADVKADAAIAVSKLVNTYFPETLLTAQGDLITRSDTVPIRLAKITTGQILQATATGYEGVAIPVPRTVATGTYTGNASDDRQITTGFKCSMVILGTAGESRIIFINAPNAIDISDGAADKTDLALHATDGFVVDQVGMNQDAVAYFYFAISE